MLWRRASVAVLTGFLIGCSPSPSQTYSPAPTYGGPINCKAGMPPMEPQCVLWIMMYGGQPSERQSCLTDIQHYMQDIEEWRVCHKAFVQNDATRSDLAKKSDIAFTDSEADRAFMEAQQKARCIANYERC